MDTTRAPYGGAALVLVAGFLGLLWGDLLLQLLPRVADRPAPAEAEARAIVAAADFLKRYRVS
jgi:hypothetical protein